MWLHWDLFNLVFFAVSASLIWLNKWGNLRWSDFQRDYEFYKFAFQFNSQCIAYTALNTLF